MVFNLISQDIALDTTGYHAQNNSHDMEQGLDAPKGQFNALLSKIAEKNCFSYKSVVGFNYFYLNPQSSGDNGKEF
jgi:hypothetical protein